MKILLNDVHTYRVDTVEEVEQLHQELKENPAFTLVSFSYKTKYIKLKGEIIDEYQLVTAKIMFTDEKEPTADVIVTYEV
jgi:uncharacterized pyridoxamine 5'-phosphate oxidase family protein